MRLGTICAAVLAAAGCGGGDGDGGDPNNCTESNAVQASAVTLAGMRFSPACVKVRAGGTITFTAADREIHNVTTDGGQAISFQSPDLALGDQYPRTFPTPGTVNVHCTFHVAMGMRATIVVTQ